MAEQSTTPSKGSDEVRKSEARSQAEGKSSRATKGSKHQASVEMTWHSPAVSVEAGSDENVHPMTGKSLEYTSGPGRENFRENFLATDSVNSLDHLAHAMVPRNQFD
jgi:hypothetical protein